MENPLTISNTTPLINFAEIGRLDVLKTLFSPLVIPAAVASELTEKSHIFPAAAAAVTGGMLQILAPADRLLVSSLSTTIHLGEAECIALAMENPGSLLLLDDLDARSVAGANRLLYTGTLGCLAEAKARGLVPAVAPLIDSLRSEARFWITDKLRQQVLNDLDEA